MRFDAEKVLIEDQVLIGNDAVAIKLKYTNQYIFFSQRDYSYLKTHKFIHLEPLSTINSEE